MPVITFEKNDTGFLKWVAEHKDGWVVNSRKQFDPSYLVLHRSFCRSISNTHNPGGFTERAYVKICANTLREIVSYLSIRTRKKAPFSKVCSRCMPNVAGPLPNLPSPKMGF